MAFMKSPTGDDDRIVSIVEEVSHREGVGPADLPPLYHSIDPEAFSELTDSMQSSSGGSVEFTYCGYDIFVSAAGDVTVTTCDPEPTLKSEPTRRAND